MTSFEMGSVPRKENKVHVYFTYATSCGIGSAVGFHDLTHPRQAPWIPKACRKADSDCGWHASLVGIARESATEPARAITAADTDSIAFTAQRRAAGDLVVLPP